MWNAGAVTSSGGVSATTGTFSSTLGVTGNVTLSGTGNSVGTITSGVWNAGAVTSSGGVSATTGTWSGLQTVGGVDGDAYGFYSLTDDSLRWAVGTGATGLFNIIQKGNNWVSQGTRVTINRNGTQTWAPYGAGTATFDASANITSVSDARYKDRITPLSYGLAEVLQLWPVQHGYNEVSGLERDHLYGGFVAQDVQTVMPLAVGMDQRGYLTLSDRPILGAVVNGMQELAARVAALETRCA